MTVSLRVIRPSRFKVIDAAKTKQAARDGIREYLNEVKKIMQDNYKTVPESPTYKRKGFKEGGLRGGWRVKVRSHNFGDLVNDVPHAGFVQGGRTGGVGNRTQLSKMRKRGWKSVADVTRQTAKRYEQIMNRKILSGVR